ncbi:hypothetical protein TNCV_1819591 [Trichonephila clavipes]|nr:hypothetical protein TNCV_1819591 [Trichonephila clavipes]
MNFVILDHGQVRRTTPDLTLPSHNYHINEITFELSTENVHLALIRWVLSGTRLELMTRRPRVRYLEATAAKFERKVTSKLFNSSDNVSEKTVNHDKVELL